MFSLHRNNCKVNKSCDYKAINLMKKIPKFTLTMTFSYKYDFIELLHLLVPKKREMIGDGDIVMKM